MDKAQAQFEADDFLASIGGDYNKVKPRSFPVLERILIKAGLQLNKQIGKNLKKAKAIASGNLLDVEAPVVYKFGNKYVLEFGYPINSKQAKYYDYVNRGVKGTTNEKAAGDSPYQFKSSKNAIPVQPIKEWLQNAKSKSVSIQKYRKLGTERKFGKLNKKTKSLVNSEAYPYMLAHSIHRKGIKTTRYMDDAIKLILNDDFKQAISTAIDADITFELRQVWQ